MNQYILAFLTGLTTGGLSCFAIQGGLLAGIIADQEKKEKRESITLFLIAKIIAHLLLGGLLGLLGSYLIINSSLQGLMQILSGFFIILMALKISDIHPIFRNFSITPPKFIFRFVRNESKVKKVFAPFLIGLLTVLIPCGITQAMMILSVSSGNFWYGSLLLGLFILGTTPIFYMLGLASEKILSIKSLKFLAITFMIYLGLTSINSGQILRGSPHTWQNYKSVIFNTKNNQEVKGASIKNGVQEVIINVSNSGYKTDTKQVKIGVPVKLTVITKSVQSCARSFVIPSMNINKLLPSSGVEIFEFTPDKLGPLTFTCSMGMYTGSFEVIN